MDSDWWMSVVREKVGALRYGVIQIVVHNSSVVQIESTERIRYNNAPTARRSKSIPAEDGV
jgi:hypothetical protein